MSNELEHQPKDKRFRSDPLINDLEYIFSLRPKFNLAEFDVSLSYLVGDAKRKNIVETLYNSVLTKIETQSIPGATVEYLNFIQKGSNRAKRYIIIENKTQSGRKLLIYITFQTYGDFLYVSVKNFAIPTWRDQFRYFAKFWLVEILLGFVAYDYIDKYIYKLAKVNPPQSAKIKQKERLRQMDKRIEEFYKPSTKRTFWQMYDPNAFELDDMLMFFKSTVPLVLKTIQKVFEQNDIPVNALEGYINNISYSTIQINTGGGAANFLNSVIGGLGNQVSSKLNRDSE